jgi:hypothetical protein
MWRKQFTGGGADPRSARVPLDPLLARTIQRLRNGGRPTRASAADQGVRPTSGKNFAALRRVRPRQATKVTPLP